VILEHALLSVRPGREAEFESAFADARAIIAFPDVEHLTTVLTTDPVRS
jgi:hypothetical protein